MKKSNKKKGNEILAIKKYISSKQVTTILTIVLFILLIFYIIILFIIQMDNHNLDLKFRKLIVAFNIAQDFLQVIISIIGTTLITSLLIEVNQKNVTYTKMIANDIFAAPEFYSNLTEENKEKMLLNLETNIYGMDPIQIKICDLFRKKINNIPHEYYYEECNSNISYFPNKNYDEKNTIRTMKVRSYANDYNEKNFYFFLIF